MTAELLINLSYVVAAILFIFGLKLLSSAATARRGNVISAVGMFIAVVMTLLDQGIVDYRWIAVGIIVGSIIGVLGARLVAMTAMPEMVALFNGFGGLASLLVSWLIATPLLSTTSVMLVTVLLALIGYRIQRRAAVTAPQPLCSEG